MRYIVFEMSEKDCPTFLRGLGLLERVDAKLFCSLCRKKEGAVRCERLCVDECRDEGSLRKEERSAVLETGEKARGG